MTNNPDLHTFQRQQLAQWLEAYKIDGLLREGEPEHGAHETYQRPGNKTHVSMPSPGQVHLLPPTKLSLPEIERPVFVLILPAETQQKITIVPFSRFATPATPQEWRSGLRQPPLRVLCLWNARNIRTTGLCKSWHVTSIPEKKLHEIKDLIRNLKPLQQTPPRRFGPPLLHPLDPRHTYLHAEQMLVLDLVEAINPQNKNAIYYDVPESNTEYLKAAEPPPEEE